jgi:uncharacterized membrane protein YbhN (UPF0104 family)
VSRGVRSFARGASQAQERRLRSGILTGALLSVLLGGLVLAVPGLRTVSASIRHARPGWIALAVGLEIASCVGYVLAFQGTFERLPRRFATFVAASELAFGAVVPLGGAGGIAAGGWLLARRGIPIRRIAERSAVLFLLTSATNVVALLLAAGGLAAGWWGGPHDLLRTVVPATVALVVLLVFLALAGLATGASPDHHSSARWMPLRAVGDSTVATMRLIRRPGWRLAVGAPAYLLCDVAALWLCIHALGRGVPAAPLLVAYLLGYLANAIPVPGGIGVLDGGLAAALVAYHVPAATAVGGVLIYHALALWIPTVSGTLAFVAAVKERVPPQSTPGIARSPVSRCGPATVESAGERDDLAHLGSEPWPRSVAAELPQPTMEGHHAAHHRPPERLGKSA